MATIVQQPALSRIGRGPLFLATILTGSFLLFLVQPMIARMALPRLGGAPAVWNSAMLVYQALLLGGYAYAHAIGRLTPARQAMVHIALFAVAAVWLPMGLIAGNPPADADPVVWVPWLLALSIGPLFFAVAAQAPLMQRWYGLASGGRDPYALYAASNLGSFGGLIAYPLLVEPRMTIAHQSLLWTGGYGLLALLVIACTLTLPRGSAVATATPEPRSEKPALVRQLHWIALATVPSGLMLSTTTHLTTDIVAMPLLWVIPLALYLLSFSVAFAGNRLLADAITKTAPVMILILGGFALLQDLDRPLLRAGLSLLLLFIVSVALHTHMYRLRPAPDRLTGFYLAMSIGGVVGGLFAALLAPVLFDWTYEHPILILAAMLLVPQAHWLAALRNGWGTGQRTRILTLAVSLATLLLMVWSVSSGQSALAGTAILVLGVLSLGRRIAVTAALAGLMMIFGGWQSVAASLTDNARTRSYFGIYTVTKTADGETMRLVHGTTVHGTQVLTPGNRTQATSYYVPSSGVGRALTLLPLLHGPNARVGIVGLGAGTLACYARTGQSWRFYEIDPAVVRIARDAGQFSFLSQCTPGAPIDIGDARLTLQTAPPASLDFLALDAFSSDAVPMHLLTQEAFGIYRRVLSPGGVLLVHISNRYLDLEPAIASAASAGGWHAITMPYNMSRDPKATKLAASSLWVAMSPDPQVIARLVAAGQGDASGSWRPVLARPGFAAWTDDFSSILPLVKAWAPQGQETGAKPH
jgi:SAM-dependent methyltransferase